MATGSNIAEAILRLDASQIPGEAAKAAAAIGRVDASAEAAAGQLQVTTRQVDRLSDAYTRQVGHAAVVNRSSGAVSAGLFNLGQQAQDVGVQLSMGASPFLVLAQQGPQIATAVSQIGGLSATLSALGAVLAPLAPVVVGLAAGFALFAAPLALANHELEKMEEKANKAADAADRLSKARKGWADQRDSIAMDVRIAAGELTEAEAAYLRAEATYRKAREAGQRVMQDTVAAAEGADPNARTSAPASGTVAARRALQAYNEATERYATLAGLVAQKRVEDADATKGQTSAAKDHTAALREEEEAYRRMMATSRARGSFDEAIRSAEAALALSRGELDQADLTLVQLEAMGNQVAAANALRAEGYVKEQEHLANLVAGVNDYTASIDRATESARGLTAAQMAGKAAGMTGTVAGGPQAVMGAVGSMGPWGALIVAIVQLVTNLEDVVNQFTDFHVKLMESISSLPETIAKVLPDALVRGTEAALTMLPDLFASLAKAIPDLAMALVEVIPEMAVSFITELIIGIPVMAAEFLVAVTDPETWKEVGKAFVEGITESWFSLGESGKDAGSNLGSSARQAESNFDAVFGTSLGKGSGKGSSSRRSAGGTTVNFYAPVLGIGPDTGDALAAEMATIAGRRRPA